MASVYDSDLSSLPVTQALRSVWGPRTVTANAVASPAAMDAVLTAVHDLEVRVAALEP
jgi:hypothetical protein